jgi:hypothetical protein
VRVHREPALHHQHGAALVLLFLLR